MTVALLIRDRLNGVLEDGTYEALVIAVDGGVLSLTIVSGSHKGAVVDVRDARLHEDAVELLAMPCVLVVRGGEPKVVFD
jgi:hypothetical protein